MYFDALGKLSQEQILVNVVNAEFLEHRPQISLVDELLSITLLFEKANGVDHGAEYCLVLKELRADSWKCLTAGYVEGCSYALQVVQPGVQVDQ